MPTSSSLRLTTRSSRSTSLDCSPSVHRFVSNGIRDSDQLVVELTWRRRWPLGCSPVKSSSSVIRSSPPSSATTVSVRKTDVAAFHDHRWRSPSKGCRPRPSPPPLMALGSMVDIQHGSMSDAADIPGLSAPRRAVNGRSRVIVSVTRFLSLGRRHDDDDAPTLRFTAAGNEILV